MVGEDRALLVERGEQAAEVGARRALGPGDECDEASMEIRRGHSAVDGEIPEADPLEPGGEIIERVGVLREVEHATPGVGEGRGDRDGDLGGAGARRRVDDDGLPHDRGIDDGLLVTVDVDREELLLRLPVGQRARELTRTRGDGLVLGSVLVGGFRGGALGGPGLGGGAPLGAFAGGGLAGRALPLFDADRHSGAAGRCGACGSGGLVAGGGIVARCGLFIRSGLLSGRLRSGSGGRFTRLGVDVPGAVRIGLDVTGLPTGRAVRLAGTTGRGASIRTGVVRIRARALRVGAGFIVRAPIRGPGRGAVGAGGGLLGPSGLICGARLRGSGRPLRVRSTGFPGRGPGRPGLRRGAPGAIRRRAVPDGERLGRLPLVRCGSMGSGTAEAPAGGLVAGERAEHRVPGRQLLADERARDVGEGRDDQPLVDEQPRDALGERPQALEHRRRVEAVAVPGRLDPFVDVDRHPVMALEVRHKRGVDRDLVVEHDLEVLDPTAAGHELHVPEHDRGDVLGTGAGLLAVPRGEADGEVGGVDAALIGELLGLLADRAGAPPGVGQQLLVADQARQAGGPAGEQLRQPRGVGAGELDRAVAGIAELEHGVPTADPGSLFLPCSERRADGGLGSRIGI